MLSENLLRLLSWPRRRASDFLSILKSKSFVALRYEGTLAGEGKQPLSLLYLGREHYAKDFETYLGASATVKVQAPLELFRGDFAHFLMMRAEIERAWSRPDVVVKEAFREGGSSAEGFFHSAFLDGLLPMQARVEEQIAHVRSKAHRRRLRQALKKNVRWELKRDTSSFEYFYDRLYAPYVRGKFGLRAHLDEREALKSRFERSGELLMIREDDVVISGALLFEDLKGRLNYYRNGFLEGYRWGPGLLAKRTAEMELALFQCSVGRFRLIDLGYTRALLNDGLLVHKRRLGCTFVPVDWAPGFRVNLAPPTRAAVLEHFPMLTGVPGQFTAQLGYVSGPPRTKQAWRALFKNCRIPGLVKAILHTQAPAQDPGLQLCEATLKELLGPERVCLSKPQ